MFKRDVLMHQNQIKSVSLKFEPLQYIAIYYNGSIFNETDFICNLPSIEIQSPPVEGTGAGTGTLHVVPAAPLKVS